MSRFVLDSFALLVFFEEQKDWKKVEHYLVLGSQDKVDLLMSLINYGEIYYITAQREGIKKAEEIIALVDRLPIKILAPDKAQTISAAKFKADGGISYADCFAASLAQLHKAKLVTGDPEFKKLGNQIGIEWITK